MSAWPPERWHWIDERTRAEHALLAPGDHCLYLGEYRARGGWAGGPMNGLIADFKRSPAHIHASAHAAALAACKARAIRTVAGALRRAFSRLTVETQLTFVPIPPSALAGASDYCDRLERALALAFAGWDADIRPLLRHTEATVADHARGGARASFAELLEITQVDHAQLDRPLRPLITLFDDVLASGKHLAVARYRLREVLPHQAIVSLCIARRAAPRSRLG